MTLATQAMEAFGISGQQGVRHRGWTGRLPLDRLAWRRIVRFLGPSHYMEKLLLSRAKPRTTRQCKSEGTLTARSRSVPCSSGRRRCGGLRTHCTPLAGPVVAVPAGSATITAPEEASGGSLGPLAAIQTRNRTLEHYRAPLSNRHGCQINPT
jgi:hypothetical protein